MQHVSVSAMFLISIEILLAILYTDQLHHSNHFLGSLVPGTMTLAVIYGLVKPSGSFSCPLNHSGMVFMCVCVGGKCHVPLLQ